MHVSPISGAALALILIVAHAPAATIYSDLRDLAIPSDFDGIYLDLDTGVTSTAEFAGWDINPFFAGTAIGNSPSFQPVRIGTDQLDSVLNLSTGTVVSASLLYASGFGGSGSSGQEHLGPGGGQFQVGVEGYLGFRFTTNADLGPFYGWMRVVLRNNSAGALIRDWAYDDEGDSISVGRVHQDTPANGAQTFTLSPAEGESFTLASAINDTGGNTNHVVKSGAGTGTLAAANTHTGTTTVTGGRLELANVGGPSLGSTASLTVGHAAELLISRDEQVNNAASVTLSGGTIIRGAGVNETFGALDLTGASTIDFGSGSPGSLVFGLYENGTVPDFKLTVTNFSAGNTLVFGSDIGSYLAAASSGAYSGSHFAFDQGFTTHWNGSTFTITAIPEPTTFAAAVGLLALCLFAYHRRRSSFSR